MIIDQASIKQPITLLRQLSLRALRQVSCRPHSVNFSLQHCISLFCPTSLGWSWSIIKVDHCLLPRTILDRQSLTRTFFPRLRYLLTTSKYPSLTVRTSEKARKESRVRRTKANKGDSNNVSTKHVDECDEWTTRYRDWAVPLKVSTQHVTTSDPAGQPDERASKQRPRQHRFHLPA